MSKLSIFWKYEKVGGCTGDRTLNLTVKSRLLYQLSYTPRNIRIIPIECIFFNRLFFLNLRHYNIIHNPFIILF